MFAHLRHNLTEKGKGAWRPNFCHARGHIVYIDMSHMRRLAGKYCMTASFFTCQAIHDVSLGGAEAHYSALRMTLRLRCPSWKLRLNF